MIRMWIDACRPKTLVAALVPVVMGGLVFWIYGDPLHLGAQRDYLFTFFSCLGFALSAQILSNFSNDLGDSLRGADNQNRVGPRRAVANGLISVRAMKRAIWLVIVLACLAGWSLGMHHPILFIPGILALILAMGYTLGPLPLAYHGLGDVFVVACFGLQATALTVYALYLEVGKTVVCEMPWTPAIIAGLGVGLLANNILIANNTRDMETDAASAKKTLVVRNGRTFAKIHYSFNLFVGILCLNTVFGPLPLVIMPLAFWQMAGFWKAQAAAEFIPFLARAAVLMLLTAILCVTGTCLGLIPVKF
jgi:1,4-dihydroxy-2-naphthoate octaprenyltransferase